MSIRINPETAPNALVLDNTQAITVTDKDSKLTVTYLNEDNICLKIDIQ